MIEDERLQLAQRLVLRHLHRELGAELRLPAGPLHVHHELARDRTRDVLTHVVGDQREGEVHTRGHAGG